MIAFILLTGVRDGAAASLKLKHVDLADGKVVQDAREVEDEVLEDVHNVVLPGGRRGWPR